MIALNSRKFWVRHFSWATCCAGKLRLFMLAKLASMCMTAFPLLSRTVKENLEHNGNNSLNHIDSI